MERNGVIVVATRNGGQEQNSRVLALLSLAYAGPVKLSWMYSYEHWSEPDSRLSSK